MPSALLTASLDYQGAVTAALHAAGVLRAGFPALSWYELAALDASRAAGVSPEAFAAEVIAIRGVGATMTLEIERRDGSGGAIRPSHAQANRWALDAGDSCECGHAKASHDDSGRCRAQRGRCTCRAFVRCGASARAN